MNTDLFVLTRAIHFSACLLLFGWIAFGFTAAMPSADAALIEFWRKGLRRCSWILLPVILVSGGAWFVLVALDMSGGPLRLETLQAVWLQTRFGNNWQCRTLLWLAAVGLTVLSYQSKAPTSFRNTWLWLQLGLAGYLLGSLAWAGHGREGGLWHLLADTLHLLVAGIWPTGLLPLFLLLRHLHASAGSAQMPLTIPLIRHFSVSSLISVALLSATGLANSWFLVGSPSNLISQPYGRWLLFKVGLFLVAVAIGAVNLIRLRPHLLQPAAFPRATSQIRRNVLVELILAGAIITAVALLGILPPAITH